MKTEQFNHKNLFKITHTNGDDNYQALEQVKGFNEIYKHYCDFAKAVDTAYLENATNYVMGKLKQEDGRDNIKTACYYASSKLQQDKNNTHKEKMLKDGWLELTEDIVKTAYKDKKKLEVIAKTEGYFTTTINKIYKPFYSEDNGAMLMKPRATRNGYRLYQFNNAFCKII